MATKKEISANPVEAQDIVKKSLDLSAQSDSDLLAGDVPISANGETQLPVSAANDDFCASEAIIDGNSLFMIFD